MSIIPRTPFLRFLLLAAILYFSWYLLYQFVIHPSESTDLYVIDNTVTVVEKILTTLGYTIFKGEERVIGIDGTPGLWIGDKCNGIDLFALFTIFVIAYPGTLLKKCFFIPIGILSIQLINILRVVGLSIVQLHAPKWTEFNHTYVFNVLVYGYIFLLWMIWVNKFSETKMPLTIRAERDEK